MESYRLLFLKVSEKWAHRLSERMPQCPRVVFLSKLKGDKIVIGMYAENNETMESQVESFERMVDTEILDTYEIEEFVTPYWEFEVLDKERK